MRPYFRQIRDSSGQSTTHIRQPTTTSLPEVNYVAPSVMDAPALYVPTMQLDQVQYALNIINALPPIRAKGLVLTKESRDWNMVFGALEDASDYSRTLDRNARRPILAADDVLRSYFDPIADGIAPVDVSDSTIPRPIAM